MDQFYIDQNGNVVFGKDLAAPKYEVLLMEWDEEITDLDYALAEAEAYLDVLATEE